MYVQWSKKNVDKKKLDFFLKKHLMKWTLDPNPVRLVLTAGASQVLIQRKATLEQTTLKLILMSGAAELVKIIVDILPDNLLLEAAKNQGYWKTLSNLPEDKLRLIAPVLTANPEDLADTGNYRGLCESLWRLLPDFQRTCLSNTTLRGWMARMHGLQPDILVEILEQDPTSAHYVFGYGPGVEMVSKGILKISVNKEALHESTTESAT